MVGTFHRETVGGDRFFDLLARLEKDPSANLELLEFLYNCLSLGFEGRLRVEDRGSDKHLQIRNSLARIIRGQRGSPEYDLSPHWKGMNKPHRARSLWKPFWIALVVTCVLLAGTYSTLVFLLGRQAGPVVGTIIALTTSTPPKLDRPAPPLEEPKIEVKPTGFDEVVVEGKEKKTITIVEFLKDEIDQKKVEVKETPTELKVFLVGQGLFQSGSDQLEDGLEAVVARVGEALAKEQGPIVVAGYTDNVPLSGRGRFKDNVALSNARAQQVAKLLAKQLGGFDRLTAEGHGDEKPIADNATAEGRAQNRRVEIILLKQEGT